MSIFRDFHAPPPAFLLALGLLVTIVWLLFPDRPALPPTASQRVLRPGGVTQIDFHRLHPGGTSPSDTTTYTKTRYAQGAARMGEGSLLEVLPDGRTRPYQWNGGCRCSTGSDLSRWIFGR
ncbi:hypothetical protein DNI29_23310 [Hymenobacter sediminis]|uniref:hypothetical protein n=1 Tax=Hymenobacter sediminis TaxID=2218621 RepID=UPI000DA666B8|nr:hypothetical protein [Hymenobacter sediminis]RPD43668.1 hypothetical protein DNI29_23310 [Hymenobacter sediminis]